MPRYVAVVSPRRNELVNAGHADGLMGMNKDNIGIFFGSIPGLPYDMARNRLAEQVFEQRRAMRLAVPPVEIEGVLWVDDDVTVPNDALMKLMDHNKPLVSALYFARKLPHTPQMYRLAPGQADKYWPVLDWEKGSSIEVDAVGFGCIYMRFEVLEAIRELPGFGEWFKFEWPRGEDFYFCRLAKEAGYKLLVDTSIKCGHVTSVIVNEQIYDAIRPRLVRLDENGKPIDEVPEGEKYNVEMQ